MDSIELESLGSSLSDAKGFVATMRLMWRQTYPIFMPPYLSNMIMLLYLSIACYVVSQGFYMWSVFCFGYQYQYRTLFVYEICARTPQILSFYLPRIDTGLTVCGAVEAGIFDLVQAAANK